MLQKTEGWGQMGRVLLYTERSDNAGSSQVRIYVEIYSWDQRDHQAPEPKAAARSVYSSDKRETMWLHLDEQGEW